MYDKALTLEELREMDGEPVWVEHCNGGEWVVVAWNIYDEIAYVRKARLAMDAYGSDGVEGWLAYRRRPEEASRMKHVCAATGGPCCWCNPGPCNSRKPESGDSNA